MVLRFVNDFVNSLYSRVLRSRIEAQIELVLDDVRREQDEQVHLLLGLRRVLEKVAEDRDVAEERDLGDVVDLALLDEAADDDALLVVHDDLRVAACARSRSGRGRGP